MSATAFGDKKIGVCADKIAPVAVFPAHWAPNGITHYDKNNSPSTTEMACLSRSMVRGIERRIHKPDTAD